MLPLAAITFGGLFGIALIVIILAIIYGCAPAANGDAVYSGTLPLAEGRVCVWGRAYFSGTGATVAVAVKLRRIECLLVTPHTGGASDEIISPPATTDGSSFLVSSTTGQVTFTRTGASKTSGLGFEFLAIGYA